MYERCLQFVLPKILIKIGDVVPEKVIKAALNILSQIIMVINRFPQSSCEYDKNLDESEFQVKVISNKFYVID